MKEAVLSDTLVLNLPSSGILALDTLTLFAQASTTSLGGNFTCLPMHVESLIESVQFELGGQVGPQCREKNPMLVACC